MELWHHDPFIFSRWITNRYLNSSPAFDREILIARVSILFNKCSEMICGKKVTLTVAFIFLVYVALLTGPGNAIKRYVDPFVLTEGYVNNSFLGIAVNCTAVN